MVAGCVVAFLWHRANLRAALVRADPETILRNPALREPALALGRRVFAVHCAGCHGTAGQGESARGVPDLRDADRLYGEGHVGEIETIVLYGIRAGRSKGLNLASMPAYANCRPYAAEPLPSLAPPEIEDVVQLLLSYEGRAADPAAANRGLAVYAKAGCWDCHGSEGRGDVAIGAPNLRDRTVLYGGSAAALRRSVSDGRAGTSPGFVGTLDAARIRAVSVYVASRSLKPAEVGK